MLTRFILYVLGWCVEVFWSAIEESWLKRDWRLKGQSYLWSTFRSMA